MINSCHLFLMFETFLCVAERCPEHDVHVQDGWKLRLRICSPNSVALDFFISVTSTYAIHLLPGHIICYYYFIPCYVGIFSDYLLWDYYIQLDSFGRFLRGSLCIKDISFEWDYCTYLFPPFLLKCWKSTRSSVPFYSNFWHVPAPPAPQK